MITVRQIEESDHAEISHWYAKRKWPLPPVNGIIPTNGCLAELDGEKLACCWLYLSNSTLAFIEWVATNPEIPPWRAMKGLKHCTEWLQEFCRNASPEVSVLLHITANDKLAKFYEKKLAFKNAGKENLLIWKKEGA